MQKIGDRDRAGKLYREALVIANLIDAAQDEDGFTPGLLGCVRARAAALVAEILELTPVAATKPEPVVPPAPLPPESKPKKQGHRSGKRPVELLDPETGKVLARYPTLTVAARAHGTRCARISEVCRGCAPTHPQRGRWRYARTAVQPVHLP